MRPSRLARVRARLAAMVNSQVARLDRPSNEEMLPTTASQVSCTLLGLRAAADDRVRGADERAVKATYELTERRFVAAAQTREKGRIVEIDGRHSIPPADMELM